MIYIVHQFLSEVLIITKTILNGLWMGGRKVCVAHILKFLNAPLRVLCTPM